MTLEELKAVQGDSRIRYRILDSHQFIPNKGCLYPFRDFIKTQYYRRLELRKNNDPLEQAVKIMLNSMYGKMAQRVNNKIGNLFNPVIASFITGFARARSRAVGLESFLGNTWEASISRGRFSNLIFNIWNSRRETPA